MEKIHVYVVLSLLAFSLLFHEGTARDVRRSSHSTKDAAEEWGYVEVRPKAHMFWWLYRSPYRVEKPSNPWPIILWLQGGPGASGVGIGNFEEVGPLDTNLKPRNSTWLRKADLLFVDNPVGTGYSFVENATDENLFAKSDVEAATDLTALLEGIFNQNQKLQESPLYIVAESYGGKFAATLGLSALKAIESGKLKLKLGGVALGDSWISPEDFVLSWGPLLKDLSRLDKNGLAKSNSVALRIKQQLKDGQYVEATSSWNELEQLISENSNAVDLYNFLLDSGMDPVSATAAELSVVSMNRYSRYLSTLKSSSYTPGGDGDLDSLMNGAIKKKLKIIPENVVWGGQSGLVFTALEGDFMRPRIDEVDELLAKGVNVTIYNGQVRFLISGHFQQSLPINPFWMDGPVENGAGFYQDHPLLDVICSTKGTEAWVEKLKWEGLHSFQGSQRSPLYCGDDKLTRGFIKSYKNLNFYWILGAGHFVPVDQPCIALNMVGAITDSPAST